MDDLFDIIRETFGTTRETFEDDLAFAAIENWDSLAHMMFITKLESHYSIELSGDEIADMQTIADLKQVIGRHMGRAQ